MNGSGPKNGVYLVLEGGDATGKSLQAARLVTWLEGAGHTVVHLREPGSTPTGEALRRLLLDPATGELDPRTEAMLFSAARSEMLRREVGPKLREGAVVLVERCYLSTFVYQGRACAADQAVPLELLRQMTDAAHADLWPDRILLLDVDDATRRARADDAGKADRFERRDEEFHQAVRQSYLELAAGDPRVEVVDARPAVDAVQDTLRRAVSLVLAEVAP